MARFTPDEELELLFDSKIIPDDVKQLLPDHLHVRRQRVLHLDPIIYLLTILR